MPHETDSPLVIDADAVLPSAIAPQCFELVSRRDPQASQICRRMQLQELSPRHTFNVFEPGYDLAMEKCLRIETSERTDHARIMFRNTESVKQDRAIAFEFFPYKINELQKPIFCDVMRNILI
jgi:hypothetical protein